MIAHHLSSFLIFAARGRPCGFPDRPGFHGFRFFKLWGCVPRLYLVEAPIVELAEVYRYFFALFTAFAQPNSTPAPGFALATSTTA